MLPAPNSSKPAYLSLEPGDPWTMIEAEAIQHDDGRPAQVGDMISKWFATNEPGRIFRITAVHGFTYETVFVRFEQ